MNIFCISLLSLLGGVTYNTIPGTHALRTTFTGVQSRLQTAFNAQNPSPRAKSAFDTQLKRISDQVPEEEKKNDPNYAGLKSAVTGLDAAVNKFSTDVITGISATAITLSSVFPEPIGLAISALGAFGLLFVGANKKKLSMQEIMEQAIGKKLEKMAAELKEDIKLELDRRALLKIRGELEGVRKTMDGMHKLLLVGLGTEGKLTAKDLEFINCQVDALEGAAMIGELKVLIVDSSMNAKSDKDHQRVLDLMEIYATLDLFRLALLQTARVFYSQVTDARVSSLGIEELLNSEINYSSWACFLSIQPDPKQVETKTFFVDRRNKDSWPLLRKWLEARNGAVCDRERRISLCASSLADTESARREFGCD